MQAHDSVCAESTLGVGAVLGTHHTLRASRKGFHAFGLQFLDEEPEAQRGT